MQKVEPKADPEIILITLWSKSLQFERKRLRSSRDLCQRMWAREYVLHGVGSKSRARILAFLCGNPAGPFYQRQIMYETGLSLQAIQRELRNLVNLGIVKKQKTRNRVYYGINPGSPFFNPLYHQDWGQPLTRDRGGKERSQRTGDSP